MQKGYIYIRAKKERQFSYKDLKELLQIGIGALFGGIGLYLGYCFLWIIAK